MIRFFFNFCLVFYIFISWIRYTFISRLYGKVLHFPVFCLEWSKWNMQKGPYFFGLFLVFGQIKSFWIPTPHGNSCVHFLPWQLEPPTGHNKSNTPSGVFCHPPTKATVTIQPGQPPVHRTSLVPANGQLGAALMPRVIIPFIDHVSPELSLLLSVFNR